MRIIYMKDTWQSKASALEIELEWAVDLMVRVARGEQTVQRMGEWVSLNFPQERKRLPKKMRVTPRSPRK
jgi:hypothetical protein